MEEQEFRTRYPGYDVLDKWSSPDCDDQTRLAVRRRLEEIPARLRNLADRCVHLGCIMILPRCYL